MQELLACTYVYIVYVCIYVCVCIAVCRGVCVCVYVYVHACMSSFMYIYTHHEKQREQDQGEVCRVEYITASNPKILPWRLVQRASGLWSAVLAAWLERGKAP